jgi:PAS domain S-box-containing protein
MADGRSDMEVREAAGAAPPLWDIFSSYANTDDELARQLDSTARLAARICDAPVALAILMDGDRQLIVGKAGLDLTEFHHPTASTAMTDPGDDLLVVLDSAADPRFAAHPLVAGKTGARFYAGRPLRSPQGHLIGSFGVLDTLPRDGLSPGQCEALHTLADAAAALLERLRIERESRSAIHDLRQRFEVLADAMPQLVWSTDAHGMSDYFNRGWCDFTGAPPEASFGAEWMQFVHPDDLKVANDAWTGAVASKQDYEVEYQLRRSDGQYRWMIARGLPIRDESGAVIRWLGTCTDIHEQKTEVERQEVLSRELSHRIKNIFAVIGGLISMTVRRRPELADAGRELQERVLALGRAHDFVRPHSDRSRPGFTRSSLKGMLGQLLAPYQSADNARILIVGEDLDVDDRSATALALMFHELATNAAKYGALASADGRVELCIGKDGPDVVFDWSESGGPPVPPKVERGFGTDLVDMSVTRQLGGRLDYDWRSEGLRFTARIPAAVMTREPKPELSPA